MTRERGEYAIEDVREAFEDRRLSEGYDSYTTP